MKQATVSSVKQVAIAQSHIIYRLPFPGHDAGFPRYLQTRQKSKQFSSKQYSNVVQDM